MYIDYTYHSAFAVCYIVFNYNISLAIFAEGENHIKKSFSSKKRQISVFKYLLLVINIFFIFTGSHFGVDFK